jgi:hypothetical protein
MEAWPDLLEHGDAAFLRSMAFERRTERALHVA